MLYVSCGARECDALFTRSCSVPEFHEALSAGGWVDIYADRDGEHGNGWRCPDCAPRYDDDGHEYAEYALMHLSGGNGLLVLPRVMTAADWTDLDERIKAIRVLHG